MDRELFLAILAMDSYNRGYARRLRMSEGTADDSSDNDVQLGNATIIRQSDTRNGTSGVISDFYAIAYDWNGETIISYRGTDDPAADTNTGYGLGAGYSDLVVSSWLYDQFFDYLYGDEVGGVVTDLTDAFGLDDSVSQSNLAIDFYSRAA